MSKLKFFFIGTILILNLLLFIAGNAQANNLQVSSVSLTDINTTSHTMNVKFNVSWENSFKDDINYDAAWIFIKYKSGSVEWKHATLSTITTDHSSPAGSIAETVTDGKGVYIHRNAIGAGNNNWTDVKLRWNYGADGVTDDTTGLKVKVLGIEMVFIPQGSFYAGDGSITDIQRQFTAHNTTNPFQITSENQITLGGTTPGNLGNNNNIGGENPEDFDNTTTRILPQSFPKGFKSFYCMKYEITQEQYCEFLNCLTRAQQNTRTVTDISGTTILNRYVMSNTSGMSYRNSIRCDANLPPSPNPVVFGCDLNFNGIYNESNDGQNIACNWLNWADGTAYSDWAGLRPMTELEFEKAGRGTLNPVPDEYAWGSTFVSSPNNIINGGTSDELPDIVNTNAAWGLGNVGATRVGMFARGNTTREMSGASYYGVMDLTVSLNERAVAVGIPQARLFTGTTGDGLLDLNGNATNPDWPGINSLGGGFRGGNYTTGVDANRLSSRISMGDLSDGSYRFVRGFRCVR